MENENKSYVNELSQLIGPGPKHLDIYTNKSMDILERIHDIMKEKNINQKELADLLGKKESEVSKWINGVQNFTIKTISKIEEALDEEILVVKACSLQSNILFQEDYEKVYKGGTRKTFISGPSTATHFQQKNCVVFACDGFPVQSSGL